MNGISLFSGCLGLDLGLEQAGFNALAYVEQEPNCQRVIRARRPDTPIIDDVRDKDALAEFVGLVEWLAGGFPCQDLSYAGKGAGLDGEHSGLWFDMADAVRLLRPRVVLVENVPGLATRGLGRVLYDLAEAGYVGSWLSVRAADVGAPHRRERMFILATDAERLGGAGRGAPGDVARSPGDAEGEGVQRQRGGDAADDRGAAAPDADGGRREQRDPGLGRVPLAGAGGAPDLEGAADTDSRGRGRWPHIEGEGSPGRGWSREDGEAAPDAAGGGRGRWPTREEPGDDQHGEAGDVGDQGEPAAGDSVVWGVYGPAIRRWESICGRAAPRPTDDRGRLSPRFVEWMLGFPDGWVDVDGVSRTSQLRMLGNSVQVQVGALLGSLLVDAYGLGDPFEEAA